jgi:hypothetical protein
MLDHLLEFEPPVVEATGKDVSGLDRATPDQILNAQVNTTKWLEKLGVEDDQKILQEAEAKAARTVFATLANNATPAETKNQLTLLKTPESVRHLVTLLSAYDWEFVEQAKQMRGMAVAKIIEETNHPDARIRLKAIEMLGRVTEVALFTDRLEVKKTDLTDAEIDQKLQDKLDKLLNVIDVDITVGETTADITDVEPSTLDESEHSLTSEEPPAPTDDES